jgi:hypothetical protein
VCRVVKAVVGQQLRVVWPWTGRIELVMVNGFVLGVDDEVVMPCFVLEMDWCVGKWTLGGRKWIVGCLVKG